MQLPLMLRGQRALVLHPEDQSRRNLVEALERFEIQTCVSWPVITEDLANIHVLLFDVDQGHDEQIPWSGGSSPIPLIALIGSEAPGRIEWAMSQAASAYLLKPVKSAGVYSALTIAFHQHAERAAQARHIDDLTMRLKARPLVLKVVLDEMLSNNIDDDEAFKRIRGRSMDCQMSVEEYCARRLTETPSEAAQPRTRKR